MATTYLPLFTTLVPSAGIRMNDDKSIFNAVVNMTGISRAYGITAAGTTQATATQLTAVINQIDTAASSTGVNLPSSKGKENTPFCFCIIINNGANPVTVYAAQGTSDTINGTAGATGVSLSNAVYQLYASAKPGSWFLIA